LIKKIKILIMIKAMSKKVKAKTRMILTVDTNKKHL
jgi:hypothetical protein